MSGKTSIDKDLAAAQKKAEEIVKKQVMQGKDVFLLLKKKKCKRVEDQKDQE